jgi:hypothetical protein
LKVAALPRIVWRTGLERSYGTDARDTTEWTSEWMNTTLGLRSRNSSLDRQQFKMQKRGSTVVSRRTNRRVRSGQKCIFK